MTRYSIEVEHLAKRYRIGGAKEIGYKTVRDSIAALFRRQHGPVVRETVWALRDVSFSAAEGEVIGIIGRNGAGKSTLLKILSRITEPTAGRARLRGRVGSLLEVGTGFHPELTGRENIYLNGAILGMQRIEIARKFDEIVAFAEIDRFIDTPVKRYSSGMYVRLAFAVAAYLEVDILIVDEVLAVGDANFQKKCLAKMEDVGRQGRTVLFVSHNLASVTRLCKRAVLIEGGLVARDGDVFEVTRQYLRSDAGTSAVRAWGDGTIGPGNSVVRLRSVRVIQSGVVSEVVDITKPVDIELTYQVLVSGSLLLPNLHFKNADGVVLFASLDLDPRLRTPMAEGIYVSAARIPGNLLMEGTIVVDAAISTLPADTHFYERDVVSFEVADSVGDDTARGDYVGPMPGVIKPLLTWRNQRLGE